MESPSLIVKSVSNTDMVGTLYDKGWDPINYLAAAFSLQNQTMQTHNLTNSYYALGTDSHHTLLNNLEGAQGPFMPGR